MPYAPPRWLESLGHALVPPASAEHALGDLAECSHSSGDYARNLLSILPRVVWSQVRRRATMGGIAFTAVLTGVLLLAQRFPGTFFATPWSVPRLAVPWAVWVCGVALAAAYGPRNQPHALNWRVFAAFAAIAVASAAILDVPLLRIVTGFGMTLGVILVLSMPWLKRTAPPALSPATLPVHARNFQRGIWWRNARESAACVLVIAFNVGSLWRAQTPLQMAGHTLLIAGVLFVMAYLHLRAASRVVPEGADAKMLWHFHRHELVRQRDILRAIVWWYLAPFVPGMVVLGAARWDRGAAPALVGLVVVLFLFGFVRQLNLWGAKFLDGELAKVEALEGQL
jgi:hypothetical protein